MASPPTYYVVPITTHRGRRIKGYGVFTGPPSGGQGYGKLVCAFYVKNSTAEVARYLANLMRDDLNNGVD
jgi:hypothetical protein